MNKVLTASSLINESQLNELSDNGWTLVSIVSTGALWWTKYYFYFTRNS